MSARGPRSGHRGEEAEVRAGEREAELELRGDPGPRNRRRGEDLRNDVMDSPRPTVVVAGDDGDLVDEGEDLLHEAEDREVGGKAQSLDRH